MIQRKQTIWLLLAALMMFLCFFLPFGIRQTIGTGPTEERLTAGSDTLLLVISALSMVLCVVIIFLFQNRPLQLKLLVVNMLVAAGCSGWMFWLTQQTDKGHRLVIGLLGNQLFIGVLLPVLGLFFLVLAYNGVRSDERLVKSTDRLR